MSPISTFHNCGISSSRVRAKAADAGDTGIDFSGAQTAPVAASTCPARCGTYSSLKILPRRPTQSVARRPGPATTISPPAQSAETAEAGAAAQDRTPGPKSGRRAAECRTRKPSPKIKALGCSPSPPIVVSSISTPCKRRCTPPHTGMCCWSCKATTTRCAPLGGHADRRGRKTPPRSETRRQVAPPQPTTPPCPHSWRERSASIGAGFFFCPARTHASCAAMAAKASS